MTKHGSSLPSAHAPKHDGKGQRLESKQMTATFAQGYSAPGTQAP
jgi:hypothetical protein